MIIFSRSKKKPNSHTCTTFYASFSKNIFCKTLTTLKLVQGNNPLVDVPSHPKHFDLRHFELESGRHECHL